MEARALSVQIACSVLGVSGRLLSLRKRPLSRPIAPPPHAC